MEAQEKVIGDYVDHVGGAIVGSFTEIESGKRKDRPELRKALALARKIRATLIVAKLDRLARNVAFVSNLFETPGVEFKAADCPDANRMMLQMLSIFAEYEREQISRRTKDALAARKARGFSLGRPENLVPGASPAPEMNRAQAQAQAERMRPVIDQLRRDGIRSIRAIAKALNDRGYVTARGMAWYPTSVARLLSRFDVPLRYKVA